MYYRSLCERHYSECGSKAEVAKPRTEIWQKLVCVGWVTWVVRKGRTLGSAVGFLVVVVVGL